jgi:hypothetical protein
MESLAGKRPVPGRFYSGFRTHRCAIRAIGKLQCRNDRRAIAQYRKTGTTGFFFIYGQRGYRAGPSINRRSYQGGERETHRCVCRCWPLFSVRPGLHSGSYCADRCARSTARRISLGGREYSLVKSVRARFNSHLAPAAAPARTKEHFSLVSNHRQNGVVEHQTIPRQNGPRDGPAFINASREFDELRSVRRVGGVLHRAQNARRLVRRNNELNTTT